MCSSFAVVEVCCLSWLSDYIRINLRGPKFQDFSGGRPPDPPYISCYQTWLRPLHNSLNFHFASPWEILCVSVRACVSATTTLTWYICTLKVSTIWFCLRLLRVLTRGFAKNTLFQKYGIICLPWGPSALCADRTLANGCRQAQSVEGPHGKQITPYFWNKTKQCCWNLQYNGHQARWTVSPFCVVLVIFWSTTQKGLTADCPTVPILSGQYRFEGLCPESRFTLVRTTNVPRSASSPIHAARCQQLLNYNGRGDVSSASASVRTYTVHMLARNAQEGGTVFVA